MPYRADLGCSSSYSIEKNDNRWLRIGAEQSFISTAVGIESFDRDSRDKFAIKSKCDRTWVYLTLIGDQQSRVHLSRNGSMIVLSNVRQTLV